MKAFIEDEIPDFKTYFDKLLDNIKKHVVEPRIKHNLPMNWTNNNCEAMNNILKIATQWRPQQLPELIDKVQRIVDMQLAETRRAIHCAGNFVLAPSESHFCISNNIWATKTQQEKDALVAKFYQKKRKRATTVQSTDGLLEIPNAQRLAKKPCQRKRARAAKTPTKN